jgi:hypothetical protein
MLNSRFKEGQKSMRKSMQKNNSARLLTENYRNGSQYPRNIRLFLEEYGHFEIPGTRLMLHVVE